MSKELVTDKLASYVVAHRDLMPSVERRRSKYLNNRAENSHQPTEQRERTMKFFRSSGVAQRFLTVFSVISPHLPGRHKLTASDYRFRNDRPIRHLERRHRRTLRRLNPFPTNRIRHKCGRILLIPSCVQLS